MRYAWVPLAAIVLIVLPVWSWPAGSWPTGSSPTCPPGTARAADAPEALPRPEELRQQFKEGQFHPLLQRLTRVLALKGDVARPYDRVEMLLLRAEALLQLKQYTPATEAYAAAVKAIDDQTDPKLAATARATEMLVKRARNFTYTPRSAPRGEVPKPVSVLDLEQRKAALWGLFNDLKQELAAKVKAAEANKTLLPTVEAVRSLSTLRAAELAATDQDEQSQAMLTGLATHALKLMSAGMKDLTRREADIKVSANQLIANLPPPNATVTETTYHKRGLEFRMTNDLKEIVGTCEKISQVCKDFADLSKAQADAFGAVADAADKTAAAARRTLEADYTGVFGAR